MGGVLPPRPLWRDMGDAEPWGRKWLCAKGGALPQDQHLPGQPITFLVFGKKGSHLSLSGAEEAFSAVLAGRASRSLTPA